MLAWQGQSGIQAGHRPSPTELWSVSLAREISFVSRIIKLPA